MMAPYERNLTGYTPPVRLANGGSLQRCRWRCVREQAAPTACENGDQAPQGRHRPFRALPVDPPSEGVVMLVPVLRGRAAVTLGHDTS